MAIKHLIDTASGIVFSTVTDKITDAELYESYNTLYHSNDWQPGFHELVDLSGADFSNITREGLDKINSLVGQMTKNKCNCFKTAIVASKNLTFGMARMYEAISAQSPESVMVFRDKKDALIWINE